MESQEPGQGEGKQPEVLGAESGKESGKGGKRAVTDRFTISPSEAAQVLGVSRPTVYTLIKRADFPAFKVGTRTLVSVEGLKRWVEAQAEGDAIG